MKIFAIDDEMLALRLLENTLKKVIPTAEIMTFQRPATLLEEEEASPCDVAFLDIKMRGMTGLELAEKINRINPRTNIIFVSGYREYSGDAWDLMASGFVTKPVTEEKLSAQLSRLRYPLEEKKAVESPKIEIRCFGNFEIFVHHAPLHFYYDKTKELLAYLVDHDGEECTGAEICTVLWEDDKNHTAYFQQMRKDLLTTLEKAGCAGLVEAVHGKMRVCPEKAWCDYYEYQKDHKACEYHGEYMQRYSWAEYKNGLLSEKR